MPNAIVSPLGARPSVPTVFRWSLTFAGCFDPKPWLPPVGGSAVVASPQLDGSRLSAEIISAVPYPAGWSFCCFSQSWCCLAFSDIPSRVSSFHTDCSGNPLQGIATRSIIYHSSLPLGLHISGSSCRVPLHSFLTLTRSALWRPISSTAGTLRLVSTILGKTSFLSSKLDKYALPRVNNNRF